MKRTLPVRMQSSLASLRLVDSPYVLYDQHLIYGLVQTGPFYDGPPIHTFSWFVDPVPAQSWLPDPSDPATKVVRPGDPLPNITDLDPTAWQTVVFAPGVHRWPNPFANGFTQLRSSRCSSALATSCALAPCFTRRSKRGASSLWECRWRATGCFRERR